VRRLLLKWLNAPVFILLLAYGVALQTTLFMPSPIHLLQPDIILIAVIWCALHREFTEGGILTLICGNISEIHSSAPQGVFMLTYLLVFLGVRLASRLFVIPSRTSLVSLTLVTSLFFKFGYMGALYLLGTGANQWRHLLTLLIPGALSTSILGYWLYPLLERYDWITFKNRKAEQMLGDELRLEGEG
jgi:rod shape-determining protein MreD